VLLEKKARQGDDVFPPLPQGRKGYRPGFEDSRQVRVQRPLLRGGGRVFARSCYEFRPGIVGPSLQEIPGVPGQKFLDLPVQGLDMAEHEGAPVGEVKGAVALDGTEVRRAVSLSLRPGGPEEERHGLLAGEGAAIDDDEGAALPGAQPVNARGDKGFARPRLAADEYRFDSAGETFHLSGDPGHLARLGDQGAPVRTGVHEDVEGLGSLKEVPGIPGRALKVGGHAGHDVGPQGLGLREGFRKKIAGVSENRHGFQGDDVRRNRFPRED